MKEILKKTLTCRARYYLLKEEFQEMDREDKELYLFLRGGFAAK
ncbi:hypothetical protein ANME2D_01301 [Candidatus Methanoperedens nitroreducens]|uniref:Uncharacterized protein n=1 Tax=Candidatus Methanoperedens nitratireducens TaxID=1392998 RepID=A0A062V172_9EURY|nr:hypothetical protein [Candidatus Methanoperedens nitroreducens]KCZ72866.1 hypothetical protein ANME2D_01301 [Candidatus Methanoperedens nitroreducens]MDJ1423207.1 hypothetical protein [Candidatus Methanoperedens sp.]